MNIHLKLKLGFLAALVMLVGTGVIAQYGLKRSTYDAVWVAHTYEVLAELQGLSAAVETGQAAIERESVPMSQRVGSDWGTTKQQIEVRLGRLRQMTADNPNEQRRLDVLKPALAQWLAGAATSTADNPELRYSKAEIQQMVDEEHLLLQKRLASSHASFLTAAILVGVATLSGAFFIAIGTLRIGAELRRRESAEAELRQARGALEQRVKERTADLSTAMASLEAEMAERQKAEQEVRENERRYRVFFEENPLPMEIFDPETLAFLAVNKAAMELYGYTCEEFLKMTLKDTRPQEEVQPLLEFLDSVKSADAYGGTFVTKHKSGKLITIDAKVRTIQFGDRKARLKLVTDVTEHKQLERRLQQSQKIEAVGRLAGGIAHDFNNLLTLILGYSDSILRELDQGSALRPQMLEIQAAGQRAANLTRQLLAFSRKQILKPQVLEPNSVVSGMSQMLRRLLGEDIQISLHLDAGIGQVKADPTQLEQVLLNLAVNARDAMPDGGQLVIETHNVELDQHAGTSAGVPAGSYVVLVVSDTGWGMTEEVKAKAFEPFFTTKEVGKGTGLGLSMVLGVVQQSGGTVTVYSEAGVGTTFKIYLPRLDSSPVPASVQHPASSAPHVANDATILLVEDEPSLRALASNILKRAGYTVSEAPPGNEALQIADHFAKPPDLLLTDVIMPEMSGLELAERLSRKWPGLPVLYTSGYTDHALLERNTLRDDMPFLQKPYMPQAMLEQVARTLESHSDTSGVAENRESNAVAKDSDVEHAELLAQ